MPSIFLCANPLGSTHGFWQGTEDAFPGGTRVSSECVAREWLAYFAKIIPATQR